MNRIISGGQTGADRAALDAAITVGIAHGGWCPKGRRAEDGVIPNRYDLHETRSPNSAVRTRRNVFDAGGTVLFTRGEPTGGSRLTAAIAREADKPLLQLDVEFIQKHFEAARDTFNDWIERHDIRVLNVAGSRESECPGMYAAVSEFLVKVLVPIVGPDRD